MFDRPGSGERAILVCVGLGRAPEPDRIEEFDALARSAGAQVLETVAATCRTANPRFLIGTGKVQELGERIKALGADLVVIDGTLSPSQERNLEKELQCRVLDRSGLILDIFAQRARTFEGKLQVELAQLQHMATRLVRGWTHLERQRGGGIGLRGPGETQLETDRRLIGKRIKALNDRLEKVLVQRETTRQERRRAEVPTIALVGYTNAGKSTLFNRLTRAEAYAADQLFATLDPTVRRLHLAPGLETALADTVGFVRDLPHELVAAFRSTLQEAREADLLLHVIDAADPERNERIAQVNEVLESIGAHDVPQIAVYNKIDRTGESPRAEIRRGRHHRSGLAVRPQRCRRRPAAAGAAPAARCGPVPLRPADPAAGRAGPRPPVRCGCGDLAETARRRRARGRSQPASPGPRANLPRRWPRNTRTMLALCRRRSVFTIERIAGNAGCGMSTESPSSDPDDQTRISAGAIAPMAWNDPGRKNPWGNRPEKGTADLDEALRNLQRKLSQMFGGSDGGDGDGGRDDGRGGGGGSGGGAMRGFGFSTVALVLVGVWALTGFYVVDAAERGVVTRFGQYVATTEPGLRWHVPWPIEARQVINVESIEGVQEQTRMLTSDENLVDINFAVQYRRAEPVAYAFNVRDPDQTLKEVAESAIRETVGRSQLDFVLEQGRQEITGKTKELIQRTLDSYKTGIEVTTSTCRASASRSRCRARSATRSRPARTRSASPSKPRPTRTTSCRRRRVPRRARWRTRPPTRPASSPTPRAKRSGSRCCARVTSARPASRGSGCITRRWKRSWATPTRCSSPKGSRQHDLPAARPAVQGA